MGKKKGQMPNMGDLAAIWQASGLKEKLIFTGLAIIVFRLGAQIPIWGIDPTATQQLAASGLLGFLDMFSGGALGRLSILALGIGPYITASIVMQLMSVVIPRLEEMQKEEGEAGRRKISQYTRYLTVLLAMLQGLIVVKIFTQNPAVLLPGVNEAIFYPAAVLSMMGGALFSLWLAEMITERGVGNGGSILIFVGIIAGIPFYASQTYELVAGNNALAFNLIVLMLIFLASIGLIIVLQEAVRKIFIISAKRQVGQKVYGGQNSYIPFKINPAGVMPLIFTFAVLMFPDTIINFIQQSNPEGWVQDAVRFYTKYFSAGTAGFILIQFLLIVFFTFFYASITPSMQPREIAENLRKYGSSIPGIKPGKPTSEKLEEILTRITLIGAVGLAIITLVANSSTSLLEISTLRGLGASALIILVGVALDTVNQIRVHLMARQYEGFLKPS